MVIEYFENEKKNIEDTIEDCISKYDYELAHFYSKGLEIVNNKLRILTELDHTNVLKIKRQEQTIKAIEKRYKSENFFKKLDINNTIPKESIEEVIQKHLQRRLKSAQESLKNLESKPHKLYLDKQQIDEVVFDLVNDYINRFEVKIILSNSDSLRLTIKKYSDGVIEVKFPLRSVSNESLIKEKTQNRLVNIGFMAHENDNSMSKFITLNNRKNTVNLEVKELLAVIVFDIYWYNLLDKDSYIEIIK